MVKTENSSLPIYQELCLDLFTLNAADADILKLHMYKMYSTEFLLNVRKKESYRYQRREVRVVLEGHGIHRQKR